MATLTQTVSCSCGKVKCEVNEAPIKVNCLCHCKTCSRACSVSPVHLILVPAASLVVTEGEDLIVESNNEGNKITFARCKACGSCVYQYPNSKPIRALYPVTFKIEQGEKSAKLVRS